MLEVEFELNQPAGIVGGDEVKITAGVVDPATTNPTSWLAGIRSDTTKIEVEQDGSTLDVDVQRSELTAFDHDGDGVDSPATAGVVAHRVTIAQGSGTDTIAANQRVKVSIPVDVHQVANVVYVTVDQDGSVGRAMVGLVNTTEAPADAKADVHEDFSSTLVVTFKTLAAIPSANSDVVITLPAETSAPGVTLLFTIFDRVTGEIFTVIDRDFHGL